MRMGLDDLITYCETAPKKAVQAAMAADTTVLQEARAEADMRSRGPFSTNVLRMMYNPHGPYSTANPHPPVDPSIINEQSGEFRNHWRTFGPARTADGYSGRLINDSPVADWLQYGTQFMIPRPIRDRIVERITTVRFIRVEDAIRRVLTR